MAADPDALFPIPEGARRSPRHVVLLTGPSGSGKSSLTRRLGLPAVALDDFYYDIDHPGLPQRFGSVDWDDPRTWNRPEAAEALIALCRDGEAELPIYDIPTSRRTGTVRLVIADEPVIVAEGIFAAELVDDLRSAGVLADALCLDRSRLMTFWFRLLRDIAESRKPPATLVRRGLAQCREQPERVAGWVAKGCRAVGLAEAERDIRALASGAR